MRLRTASRLAWSLWLFVAAVVGFYLLSGVADPQDLPLVVAFGSFPTVGAVIAAKRPGARIGWLFVAVGVLTAVGILGEAAYADGSLGRSGETPAAAVLGAWIQTWFWYPLVTMTTLFTMLLFPSGLPSRRWRPVLWTSVVAVGVVTAMAALSSTLQVRGRDAPNPIGVIALDNVEDTFVFQVFTTLLFAGIGAAVISLVLRFRRSGGIERQQLKWFVYAAILVALNFVASIVFPAYERSEASSFVFGFLIGLVPVSCGVAILRYRLYDIDLIINRTLVYGALTASLGAIYAALIVVAQTLVLEVGTTEELPGLVIAASTLAVAAVFQPLRTRIQGFIDRRFYRHKYDAARTLEEFSARLRDQVNLEALTRELLGVVQNTMQPAHVSLWLKQQH
jgi:hypothetical protein